MAEKDKLRVLILGSGGREHALLKACLQSGIAEEVHVAPGNGGMAAEAHGCHEVALDDNEAVVELARDLGTEFVIIGPEGPLANGLADALEAADVTVFGPNAAGARLEASKAYAKEFMARNNIPTPAAHTFTGFDAALERVERVVTFPIVIKASGLAQGKGVVIARDFDEARTALAAMLEEGRFGEAGREVLIEEYIEGEEASIMVLVSKGQFALLAPSQDHKRIGEGDKGLNTGGMGAYAPAKVITPELRSELITEIVEPAVRGLQREDIDYRGVLYVGIVLTRGGPRVLEFNVRFGDPEAQVLLPLIEGDALALMKQVADGKLKSGEVSLRDGAAITVVLAAEGYPGPYEKGDEITLPGELPEDTWVLHAGTKRSGDGKLVTNGGRVLNVTALGANLQEAAGKAYELCGKIRFKGAYYRRDIGYRQLER